MKAYGLPPPWSSGYSIPTYVEAEPPARGAMVTQWLPRGTISEVVPEYRLGEGQRLLGRADAQLGSLGGSSLNGSTLDGSSLAGSCFAGDSLGATAYQLQSMGDAGSPAMLTQYGVKTARGMIAAVKRLQPSQRAAALKAAMARIDKTLQARTERYAADARRSGTPVSKALEVGLARALSEGVVSELARLGHSRTSPQPSSLLGLGLDRARERAQGANASSYVGLGATSVMQSAIAQLAVAPVVSTTAVAVPVAKPGEKMVQVGPFTFPVGDKPFLLVDGAKAMEAIPRAWHGYIRRALVISKTEQEALAQDLTKKASATLGSGTPTTGVLHMQMQKAPTNTVWQRALHVLPGELVTMRAISPPMTAGKWSDDDDGRAMPIATFTHPVSGNKWGVFLALLGTKTAPYSVQLYVKWLPEKPWYSRALSWIANLPAAIVDAVGDAVDWVKDKTCELLANPNAAAAAAGAHPAAGAGVLVAQSMCGAAPPPPPLAQSSNTLLYVLLAGGGLIAAIALTKE